MRAAAALVLGLALALASGCAGTSESEPAPPAQAYEDERVPVPSEFEQGGVRGAEPRPVSGVSGADLGLVPIYFDFDRAAIRDDQRPRLRANANVLRAYLDDNRGSIVVEGHCDERGDEEYNLALGQRRADVVRRYLVDLGVPRTAVRIVSYGEAKPAVSGHDESAWRWNRRAEFRVSS